MPMVQLIKQNKQKSYHVQMQGLLIVPNLAAKPTPKLVFHSEESNSRIGSHRTKQNENDHKSLTSSKNQF